jgi:predicted transcriptional regulator of viral defense system
LRAWHKINNSLYNYTYSVYNISVNVNNPSPLDRIRSLLDDQHGTLLTSDLAQRNIPRTYLSVLEKKGEIVRVSRGVYRASASLEDELFNFQAVYRASVYSHETALYLHDLTDRSPLVYSICVPSGYHTISLRKSGQKIYFVKRSLFEVGIVTLPSPHSNPLRVTGLERTVCDILRSRNQMEAQMVNEGLKRYVLRKERNIDLLYAYAKRFRVQKIVRETIEVLL